MGSDNAAKSEPLPLTGERTGPGVASENYWFRRHEAAYEFALPQVIGRSVLEVGCGEGYGTARLAGTARTILGIDYDAGTIAHAQHAYPRNAHRRDAHRGPAFVRGNLAALPVPDGCFDVVVSLQVIEHVWNHPEFVRECLRALRPGDGTLLVSTPNRLTFSPGLDRPTNPFHTHEFTAAELVALLTGCGFAIDAVHGLHAGERLTRLDAVHGDFVAAQLASGPDDWPADLAGDVADVRVSDFAVLDDHVADVNRSLDLVIVARRPG